MNDFELPEFFGYVEMAKYLDISRTQAYNIAQQNGFPVVVLSPRVHRIPRQRFLEWLDDRALKAMQTVK